MKNLFSKVSSLDAVLIIFILIGLRCVFVGSDVSLALGLAATVAAVSFRRYLEFKRGPDINIELQKQLNDIKTYVTAMSMKQGLRKETIEPPTEGKRWF